MDENKHGGTLSIEAEVRGGRGMDWNRNHDGVKAKTLFGSVTWAKDHQSIVLSNVDAIVPTSMPVRGHKKGS